MNNEYLPFAFSDTSGPSSIIQNEATDQDRRHGIAKGLRSGTLERHLGGPFSGESSGGLAEAQPLPPYSGPVQTLSRAAPILLDRTRAAMLHRDSLSVPVLVVLQTASNNRLLQLPDVSRRTPISAETDGYWAPSKVSPQNRSESQRSLLNLPRKTASTYKAMGRALWDIKFTNSRKKRSQSTDRTSFQSRQALRATQRPRSC